MLYKLVDTIRRLRLVESSRHRPMGLAIWSPKQTMYPFAEVVDGIERRFSDFVSNGEYLRFRVSSTSDTLRPVAVDENEMMAGIWDGWK